MLSFKKSDYLDDESDNDGYDSRSASTHAFPFFFEGPVGHVDDSVGRVYDSVGHVCGVGYGVFFLIGIESIGDVVPLVVFVPIGLDSKGGGLIEIFWRPKS